MFFLVFLSICRVKICILIFYGLHTERMSPCRCENDLYLFFFLNDNTGSQGTYLRDGKISYLKRGKGEANVNI